MELSSQDGEISIPITTNNYGGGGGGSTNGHGHMIHHHQHHDEHNPPHPLHHNHNHNIISSTSAALVPQNPSNNGTCMQATAINISGVELDDDDDDDESYKKSVVVVRYRECLKNHAAAMGGNATDGCGEFMPSGEQGTIEALNCSACHCHRNFHRKEVEGEELEDNNNNYHHHHHSSAFNFNFNNRHHNSRKFMLPLPEALGYHHHHPTTTTVAATAAAGGNNNNNILPSRVVPPPHHGHIIMPFNYNIPSLPSESDEQEDHGGGGGGGLVSGRPTQFVKKRFRTKFTQEQKEKMLNFAEKVGWKIQKQEESLVQQLCQEIGVRRKVLKVWMHNNKHNLAKKSDSITNNHHLPTA